MSTRRTSLSVLLATSFWGGLALAQQPVDPYGTVELAGPATDAPLAPQQPINPYPVVGQPYPTVPPLPPPTLPPPPAYDRGYYQYPDGQGNCCCCCQNCSAPSPPVYYAPPVSQIPVTRVPLVLRKTGPEERIRRVSIGVHGTALYINQSHNEDMVLGGAGLQLRIRSKGRFGLEISQGFLYGSAVHGNLERTSFPFDFSLMFYVFPNKDDRHFNIYGLAGIGAMADAVNVRDQNGQKVEQDFLEFNGHLGAGLELRFQWFAIEADARIIGMIRDGSDRPATYYGSINGAPVQDKSWGATGNLYVNFWF
jgi:hypothetical protein